jgi:hypothetical protein
MIDGDYQIRHDFKDISIAVSGPKGLMVPVIRNAENLTFRGVEAEVKRLAIRARDGQITVDEMTGGTFTISNGGVFGSMLSTPIINPPQSGILGMHNIVERAIVRDGAIAIAPVMYVALSYDHRIIECDAARGEQQRASGGDVVDQTSERTHGEILGRALRRASPQANGTLARDKRAPEETGPGLQNRKTCSVMAFLTCPARHVVGFSRLSATFKMRELQLAAKQRRCCLAVLLPEILG